MLNFRKGIFYGISGFYKIFTLLVALNVCFIGPEDVMAKPAPNFSSRSFAYQLDASYFTSTANFDAEGGNFETLPSGRNYMLFLGHNTLSYAFSPKWNVYGGAEIGFGASSDPSNDRSNSNITEAYAGLNLRLKFKRLVIVPSIHSSFPLARVAEDTDEVLLNEGAMTFEGGSWLEIPFWIMKAFGYLGIRYQDENRPMLLPWSVGAEMKLGGFTVGGEVESISSITDDGETNTPKAKTDITSRVNAQSLKFYSINPSLLSINGWATYKLARNSFIQLGVGHTINGTNAAHGLTVFSAVKWTFGAIEKSNNNFDEEKALKDFTSEPQEYDENLFGDKPKPKKTRTRRKKRKKKSQQQLLNEAETSAEPFE